MAERDTDNEEWKLRTEVQLAALQHMIAQLFQTQYAQADVDDKWIAEQHNKVRKLFAGHSVGGSDPVMADHASALLSEAVEDILGDIEDMVARHRRVGR